MRAARVRLLLLGGCLVAGLTAPSPAETQGSGAVIPVQSLRFGSLLPGVATVVSAADGEGRAAIEISGRGQVTVNFTLPAGLRRVDGVLLPISFGASDGRMVNASTGAVQVFDPREEYRFSVGGNQGRVTIYLGGTALPAPGQAAGAYEGEINVRVTVSSGNT